MEVVRGELDIENASYERRSTSLDTKAGLLLGVAGVLIGLAAQVPGYLEVAAQLAAALGGGAAVWSFWPRVAGAIGPRQLRDRYLTQSADVTRLVVLNTRIALHEADEQQLHRKLARVKLSLGGLAVAGLLVIVGTIVTVATGGSHGGTARPSVGTDTGTSRR